MSEEDWSQGFAKSLAVFLNGDALPAPGSPGERALDATFYVIFNAHSESVEFTLPHADWGARWTMLLDTREARAVDEEGRGEPLPAGGTFRTEGRSVVLLKRL